MNPKDRIRENLSMLENNLDSFNSHAEQFVDKKEIKKWLSAIRWYVSHGTFKEDHPQPKGIASKPPISWLDAQIQGMTTPLSRDIGLCIEPVMRSSLMTEHAARRIMNRMTCLVNYVSTEDVKKDQQAHREAEEKKLANKKRAAKVKGERKDKREEERKAFLEKNRDRLSEQWNKRKAKERAARKKELERQRAEVSKRAQKMIAEQKQEMRERRKRGD